MKTISLSKGKVALVDDADFAALSNYKWRAMEDGGNWYACMTIGSGSYQRRLMMHRIILGLTDKKEIGDHKDGNSLNNQRSNLRKCTNQENSCNRIRKRSTKNRFKGVQYKESHKAFQAYLNVKGTYIFGGHFKNEIDAAKRYNELALEHHGEFARLNDIK